MKNILLEEEMKHFKHLVEYTNASGNFISEEGPDDNMGADPSMGGGDPSMVGADPSMGGGDPSMGGADPSMGGADPSMGGGDPSMGGAAPQGFQPQGVDQTSGIEGMGGDPSMGGGDPSMGGADPSMGGADPSIGGGEATEQPGQDDEVIDIDDLTNSQEDTEKKIDSLCKRFEKAMNSIESIEKKIGEIDARNNQYLGYLKSDFEKRNPTPMQRLTMRSTKSEPYAMTPNEYMNNYAPYNYSQESDNNGADDPQYKITKGDIDDIADYSSIARELENKKMSLRDIFGY